MSEFGTAPLHFSEALNQRRSLVKLDGNMDDRTKSGGRSSWGDWNGRPAVSDMLWHGKPSQT